MNEERILREAPRVKQPTGLTTTFLIKAAVTWMHQPLRATASGYCTAKWYEKSGRVARTIWPFCGNILDKRRGGHLIFVDFTGILPINSSVRQRMRLPMGVERGIFCFCGGSGFRVAGPVFNFGR
jgi:hypothetical protein